MNKNPMNFAMDSQCLLCFLERNIQLVRPLGSEEQTMAFADELMKLILNAPAGVTANWFAPAVADLLSEHYGLEIDRFLQEKIDSNTFVMERMEKIRSMVRSAPDPLLAGMQLAILGNYLDFSALRGNVSFDKLDDMLRQALAMELDEENRNRLCADLESAKNLLYITDNAGEIGFDRIFAETIAEKYPHLSITFCVRGGIALNDATREDAAAVGLPFPVIDNGNRVPGTQLNLLSAEAENALCAADVVIAKGMANIETMYGCGKNVYYAFLIKCQRFVDRFEKPMLTPMLVREPQ